MFRHAMHARARFGRLEVFPESDASSSGWLSSSASSLASLRDVLNDETESWARDCGNGRSDSTGSDFSVLMIKTEVVAAVLVSRIDFSCLVAKNKARFRMTSLTLRC